MGPISQKIITLTLATLLVSACSQGNFTTQLPDDPQDESSAGNGDNAGAGIVPPDVPAVVDPAPAPVTEEEKILAKYDHLDPSNLVPDKYLKAAVLYYDANLTKIKNKSVLSVIDYSKSSTTKRFFLIDMATGGVTAYHVSHGKGSDSDHDGYAEKFSNTEGSNATSLGYYMTAETYSGSNGYSLRLDGLSSTNSNARSRAVVVHGADYVQDKNVIQGRSWGCPAFSQANKTKVINLIKGGSIIYAAAK
jgi:hypothetical protein